MKEFDNEIKRHIEADMNKIEDESFTSKIVTRHLLTRKELVRKTYFNFEALIFWVVAILISIALLTLTVNNKIGFSEIQVNHCLILISLTLTALIYKWLEKVTVPNNS